LVIPLATIILYAGVILLFAQAFDLGELMSWPLKSSLTLLNKSVSFVEEIPFALIYGNHISRIEVLLLYTIVTLILVWFYNRNKWVSISILSFTLITLILSAIGRYNNAHQRQLIVYNVPKISAINILTGKHNYLISENKLINDDNQQLYYMKHYWYKCGFKTVKSFEVNDNIDTDWLTKYKNLIDISEKRIGLLITPQARLPEDSEFNYLIIGGDHAIELKQLLRVKPEMIILDSSISRKKASIIESFCKQNKLNCYNVRSQGAFVKDLSEAVH